MKNEDKLRRLYRESLAFQKKYINRIYDEIEKEEKEEKRLQKGSKPKNTGFTLSDLYQLFQFADFKRKIADECEKNALNLNFLTSTVLIKAYKKAFKNKKHGFGKNSDEAEPDKKLLESCLKTKWSGKHFTTRNVGNYKKLAKSVEEAVVDSIVNGRSRQECIKAVRIRNNISYNQAYRLVQTEMSYVINKANLDVYKDEGCNEVEILAEVNKERCCDKCRSRNGTTVKINEAKFGVNVPPFHPNCHCDVLPVAGS